MTNNMSQEEIDKLLKGIDLAIEPDPKLPPAPVQKTQLLKRRVSVCNDFSYTTPPRKTLGLKVKCSCGTPLKEVRIIMLSTRRIVGFWCNHCNITYNINEIRGAK